MNKLDHTLEHHDGWVPGWTLSTWATELQRETSSPLEIVLSRHRYMLDCSTPGAETLINFTTSGLTKCRLCAHGMRLTDKLNDQDILASCIKLDATTLVIEAGQPLLQELLSSEEFDRNQFEAFLYLGEGQHHLAILIDLKSDPVRLAVIAGTGERETMRIRARAFLTMDVHLELDQLLASAATSFGNETTICPLEYLKSRLRPATSRLAYPWFTDGESEPVWNLGTLYLIANGLLNHDESSATGLLNNVLEMVDEEGSIPIAGGHISHPFNGPPSLPLLARLTLRTYQQTRQWPGDIDQIIDRIHRCLDGYSRAVSAPGGESLISSESLILFVDDVNCLVEIYRLTGRSLDDRLRALVNKHRLTAWPRVSGMEPELSALIEFFTRITRIKNITDTGKKETADLSKLLADSENVRPTVWLLTMATAENLARVNYRLYSEWITVLHDLALIRWNRMTDKLVSSPELFHEPETMALAGFTAWSRDRKSSAFNQAKMRQQSVLSFMIRRKKWLVGGGVIVALALGVFIISVQMRQTMPESIFETNYGMAVQSYQMDQFEQALNRVEEMEKRGSDRNPMLIFLKGKILFKLNNYPAAIECFSFCHEKTPSNPVYSYNLGLSLAYQGNTEEAQQIFDSLLTVFKNTHPALAARARVAYATISEMEKMTQALESRGEKDEERGAPRRSG